MRDASVVTPNKTTRAEFPCFNGKMLIFESVPNYYWASILVAGCGFSAQETDSVENKGRRAPNRMASLFADFPILGLRAGKVEACILVRR